MFGVNLESESEDARDAPDETLRMDSISITEPPITKSERVPKPVPSRVSRAKSAGPKRMFMGVEVVDDDALGDDAPHADDLLTPPPRALKRAKVSSASARTSRSRKAPSNTLIAVGVLALTCGASLAFAISARAERHSVLYRAQLAESRVTTLEKELRLSQSRVADLEADKSRLTLELDSAKSRTELLQKKLEDGKSKAKAKKHH